MLYPTELRAHPWQPHYFTTVTSQLQLLIRVILWSTLEQHKPGHRIRRRPSPLLGAVVRVPAHPEVVDVLLASLSSQPRLPESAESVPTHAGLIEPHRFEPLCKPTCFETAVQVRRSVSVLEQQPIFAVNEDLQVLCDVLAQVNFTESRGCLDVVNDARRIPVNLLLDFDGTAPVDEMLRFESECFRNSHPGSTEQNI
jgi:hypothetical protein